MTCSGLWTALVTPFVNEKVDDKGICLLLKKQQEAGVDGIVLFGTTGESPTLTLEEKENIIRLVKSEAKDFPVIVGTGSYSTLATTDFTLKAALLGADFALVVVPYYNKPTQEGIYQHFQTVAKHSPIPIILYNIPGRTGAHIPFTTFQRLIEIPQIIGIKDSSGDLSAISEMILYAKTIRPAFSVLAGDDMLALPISVVGGAGLISVASNLIPKSMHTFIQCCMCNDFVKAREFHQKLFPLFQALFFETNPIPIKAALEFCDLPAGNPRLPLCSMSTASRKKLEKIIASLNLQELQPACVNA